MWKMFLENADEKFQTVSTCHEIDYPPKSVSEGILYFYPPPHKITTDG